LSKIKEFTFKCQSFTETLKTAQETDIVYCDPPYIDRHVDYYNSWDEIDEEKLFQLLLKIQSKFILSTWHHNDFRKNEYIGLFWSHFHIFTREHFYHVGGSEKNRNPMIEAIVANFKPVFLSYELEKSTQESIF
jgi:DNA adenine methylase